MPRGTDLGKGGRPDATFHTVRISSVFPEKRFSFPWEKANTWRFAF